MTSYDSKFACMRSGTKDDSAVVANPRRRSTDGWANGFFFASCYMVLGAIAWQAVLALMAGAR